jgi:site-specific DNA recombinase
MTGAYLRVSTQEQAQRQTIQTQRDGIERWAKANGQTIDQFYSDDGVSGNDPLEQRPAGRKLLADVQAGRLKLLLIYAIDRLGRDESGLIALTAVRDFQRYGVKVEFVSQPAPDDLYGKLMTGMLATFAGFERSLIRKRMMEGAARCARNGNWLGGLVPYGYQTAKDPAGKTQLVPAQEVPPGFRFSEADVVRRIYRMAAKGESCPAISEQLNRLGQPPGPPVSKSGRPRATRWRASRIRGLLVSTTYRGLHEFGKHRNQKDSNGNSHCVRTKPEDRIQRSCPALVSPEQWEAANRELHKNQILALGQPKHRYLLKGLIRCGICSRVYCGITMERGTYYRCLGRYQAKLLGDQPCPSRAIRADTLEAAIWSDIETFIAKPGKILKQLAGQPEGDNGLAAEIEELEASLVARTEWEARARWQHTTGLCTNGELLEQLERIRAERLEVESRLEQLRRAAMDQDRHRKALDTASSLLKRLRDKVDRPMTWKLRREAVEALVESVTVKFPEGASKPEVIVIFTFTEHLERYGFRGHRSQAAPGVVTDPKAVMPSISILPVAATRCFP